eukprot:2695409-Amphidinium_carterae.1
MVACCCVSVTCTGSHKVARLRCLSLEGLAARAQLPTNDLVELSHQWDGKLSSNMPFLPLRGPPAEGIGTDHAPCTNAARTYFLSNVGVRSWI